MWSTWDDGRISLLWRIIYKSESHVFVELREGEGSRRADNKLCNNNILLDKYQAMRMENSIFNVQIIVHEHWIWFGLDENELKEIIDQLTIEPFKNASIIGLMGMASFTDNTEQVRKEFQYLKSLQTKYNEQTLNLKLETLSIGMTADYTIAIEEGSNMIRIGSLIFGARN